MRRKRGGAGEGGEGLERGGFATGNLFGVDLSDEKKGGSFLGRRAHKGPIRGARERRGNHGAVPEIRVVGGSNCEKR